MSESTTGTYTLSQFMDWAIKGGIDRAQVILFAGWFEQNWTAEVEAHFTLIQWLEEFDRWVKRT